MHPTTLIDKPRLVARACVVAKNRRREAAIMAASASPINRGYAKYTLDLALELEESIRAAADLLIQRASREGV